MMNPRRLTSFSSIGTPLTLCVLLIEPVVLRDGCGTGPPITAYRARRAVTLLSRSGAGESGGGGAASAALGRDDAGGEPPVVGLWRSAVSHRVPFAMCPTDTLCRLTLPACVPCFLRAPTQNIKDVFN